MITLVGMPGCGKTTIGRLLARRLNLPFIDSDQVIEQRLECTIKNYFEREGERAFRDIEEMVLADLIVDGGQGVLATGGGAVLRERNRERMKARSLVVYLRASPEEILKRIRKDTKRPLLQVSDPLNRLNELFMERDPLYREAAHFVIDSGRGTTQSVINLLVMQIDQTNLVVGNNQISA